MSLFIAENRLEEVLVRAVKNPATLHEFYHLLLDSDVLVMGTVSATQGSGSTFSAGPGSQFQLETGEKDGARFLPVFTSLARMQAFAKKECRYVAMKGRALFELTRGAPVAVNPASEYGREFTAAEISQLLEPGLPRAVPLDSYPEIELPLPLADALCDLFDARGDVSMAWMIQINPDSGPMPVVGVETTASMASLMPDIEKMAQKRVPGLVFDVQQVDRNRPVAFTEVLLKAKPFYPRTPRVLN